MSTKTVYLFDAITGESLGAYPASASPLEPGIYLEPVCSTPVAPPTLVANQVAVFAAGTWSIVPDFRGQTVYDQTTGAASVVANRGPLAANLGVTLPASFILENAKTAQIVAITQSCAGAIVSGFSSSALGTAHTYPSQPNDQTNLIGAVAGGLATINFWCADSTLAWSFASHTAAQIKQVLADGGTQRMADSTKLAGLVAQVQTATTVAAVQSIVW